MYHQQFLRHNRILAALQTAELERVLPYLQWVRLGAGTQVAMAGETPRHVYFPVDGTIALFHQMENGSFTGVAVIGNEGMFSVAHVLGGKTIPYEAVVETPGHFFKVEAKTVTLLVAQMQLSVTTMLLYAQATLTQFAQSVICSKQHSLYQQFCQLMLIISDKSCSHEFEMTQAAIATILGVRRVSVTEVARDLRNQGIIDYVRGHVRINDRNGLKRRCCECYEVVSKEFDRLLGRSNCP